MKMLLEKLKITKALKIKLLVDNKSTINLTNHSLSYDKIKYIEKKYHFLRDQVNKKKLEVEFCKTELQLTDIFIKSLKNIRFGCLKMITTMNYERSIMYVIYP